MEKFLTVNEVCSAAGVKPSTFRRYRQQNPDMFPPAEKKGNQPLFSIETVEEVKAYRDEMIRRRAHAKTAAPDNSPVRPQEPREGLPNVETVSDIPSAKIDSEGDKKCSADSFLQRAETLGDSSGSVGEPYTEDETPQDFQSTFDTLDTAADAPSNLPDICLEGSCIDSCKDTAEQAAPMGDGHDTQNENQPVETAAPVVIEDKPADVITLEQRADRIRRLQADVQRGIIEIGFELIEAKKQVGHGNWAEWLRNEFDWGDRTARYFMAVAERFGKRNTYSDLKASTLKAMLALPVGSEDKFIETQADAGRPVESQSARELTANIKTFKQNQARSADTESGEVGGGKYFGVWKDNQETVDELKHADSGRYEPREDVPDTEGDNLPDNAKIDSEADTGEDFHLTPPPVDETKNLPPIALNKNSTVEWYTPAEIVEAAREVLGAIDLDPASSETANQTVKAEKFYTAADNGLDKPWSGRVWLNPPFASGVIELFVEKIISEFVFGNVTSAVMISDNATETRWFRRLVNAGAAIVFTTGRINFYKGGTFEAGSPTRGQCLFYFGDDADKFYRVFAPFGWGCRVVPRPAEKEKKTLESYNLFDETGR